MWDDTLSLVDDGVYPMVCTCKAFFAILLVENLRLHLEGEGGKKIYVMWIYYYYASSNAFSLSIVRGHTVFTL